MSFIIKKSVDRYVYEDVEYDSLNILKSRVLDRINKILVNYLKSQYELEPYNHYARVYGYNERDFYLSYLENHPNKIQEKLYEIRDETEKLNNAIRQFEWENK